MTTFYVQPGERKRTITLPSSCSQFTVQVAHFVSIYASELTRIINDHAPMQKKEITVRLNTEWYTDELRLAKRECRKAERMMRKTNLAVHREIYQEQRSFKSASIQK